MNTKNKELFLKNINDYFGKYADRYIELMNDSVRSAFFLNEKKASRDEIFELIDFKYESSSLTNKSFYYLDNSIGKSKAYELGLIYPQDIESSLPTTFIDTDNIRMAIDLCAAPGGKSINILNRLNNDVLYIANDINYKRALILKNNLERLGLDAIVTSNKIEYYRDNFKGLFDLVILDVPCSGEGMIRKYPEILDEYSDENIDALAYKQEILLDEAYELLNEGGKLLYSTCTYAYKEDEDQIIKFLNKHQDMKLIELPKLDNINKLNGTIKLSPLNDTEGQFMALLIKDGHPSIKEYKYCKQIKNDLVKKFIKDNLIIDDYYLYNIKDDYYLSLKPLIKIDYNILNYGIYLGQIKNNRFEPAHNLYRSNSLKGKYKYVYELNLKEYDDFISGKELKISGDENYYLLTYKNHSLGFGKLSKGILKNKYPKGLRRVV